MPETELTKGQSSLTRIYDQMGAQNPDWVTLAGDLINVSRYLLRGHGDEREIDRIGTKWLQQTLGGQNPSDAITEDVTQFHHTLESIVSLRNPGDVYRFDIPGGFGIVRLFFQRGNDNKPNATIEAGASTENLRATLQQLKPGSIPSDV